MTDNHQTMATLPLRWLYVDFNSYFASIEQQLQPALRNRPVAVLPVMTESTSVIAASYEAKAFGIRTGTPVYEARRLCPDIICVSGRHEHYVDYHHRLIAEIDNHIPVSVVASIDEMACELMDNERSPEAITRIAQSIKAGIAKNIGEYVRCSIGVAPNRYLAKVATDLKKPDGFTILAAEDIPQRLLSLKLRDLPGIGWNMEKRLHRAGIFDMQALLALSPKHMRKIWHSLWGEKMWYMLRGMEVAEVETTRNSIGHSHVMAPELRPQPQARHVARRLTQKVASRLRRLGFHATVLSFSARLEEGGRWAGEARCYRARDTLTFLGMLEELWAVMQRETRGARLKKVSITLYGLTPEGAEEPELFAALSDHHQRRRMKAEKLSVAMDVLNQRYGRDTVLVGTLPREGRGFSGTRIAFTRIPDKQEFWE